MFERYFHLALYFPVLIINTHKLIDYVSVRSLVFKTEPLDKYSEFIKPSSGEIHDKIGRAHLKTPHSGSIHLRLRSTKYMAQVLLLMLMICIISLATIKNLLL